MSMETGSNHLVRRVYPLLNKDVVFMAHPLSLHPMYLAAENIQHSDQSHLQAAIAGFLTQVEDWQKQEGQDPNLVPCFRTAHANEKDFNFSENVGLIARTDNLRLQVLESRKVIGDIKKYADLHNISWQGILHLKDSIQQNPNYGKVYSAANPMAAKRSA